VRTGAVSVISGVAKTGEPSPQPSAAPGYRRWCAAA